MALIKIKDRYIYLNNQREKLLRDMLLGDIPILKKLSSKFQGTKMAVELDKKIVTYLTGIYDKSKDEFEEEWADICLSDKDAHFQVADIVMDWCSLHRGYSVKDERAFEEKFYDDRTGKDRLYPLGTIFYLVSSPTPDYVKLIGWNPSFAVRIDCDEVEEIDGAIDMGICITLRQYEINLTDRIEVVPRYKEELDALFKKRDK